MTNEQDLRFLQLWDCYNGLLTPTQQSITDLYFNYDLSISEIAAEKGITRQGVQECLKTCKRQLEEYEKALRIREKLSEVSLDVSLRVTDALRWAEEFSAAHPGLETDILKLKDIFDKDYSAEVKAALKKTDKV